jgi:hypothetical protein
MQRFFSIFSRVEMQSRAGPFRHSSSKLFT